MRDGMGRGRATAPRRRFAESIGSSAAAKWGERWKCRGQRDPATLADGPAVIDAAVIETGQLLSGERGLSWLPKLVALGGRGRPAPGQRGGRTIDVGGATGRDGSASCTKAAHCSLVHRVQDAGVRPAGGSMQLKPKHHSRVGSGPTSGRGGGDAVFLGSSASNLANFRLALCGDTANRAKARDTQPTRIRAAPMMIKN